MAVIRLSYEEDVELKDVLGRLGNSVEYCKKKPANGKYRRAYIGVKVKNIHNIMDAKTC